MPTIPSLKDMLKAGVHFGHRASRWHPKMAPFIFGKRSGVHVIDLEKTQVQLKESLDFVENLVARGGTLLFVGTKKQYQEVLESHATRVGAPFINTRWLGGTFTNFGEIRKLIKQYLDLKDKREKGELRKYTKLEQLQFDRKIEELEEKIGGISGITKLPEAIYVLDVRHEKTAVQEARKCGVKVVAICDTNVNVSKIDYVIPANDDSIASVTMITRLIADAVQVGKARAKTSREQAAQRAVAAKEGVVAVKAEAKAVVEDLDDTVKESLVREKAETKK